MASAIAALVLPVPSDGLLQKARQIANQDVAKYLGNVKAESWYDYSATQINNVVSDLNNTLKDTSGMKTVGAEIKACVLPLLTPEQISPSDDIYALFKLTPEAVEAIKASSEKVKATLNVTCSKIPKGKNIDNNKTVFYMLVVLLKYSRANHVFDLHYAYVYARDTSVWKWLRADDDKGKRRASLEVESKNTLFRKLADKSNGRVSVVADDNEFEAELLPLDGSVPVVTDDKELEAKLPALCVSVPSDALLKKARQFLDQDFFASHQRNVKAEYVSNYSAQQIMGVVAGLHNTLKDTPGMQKVGEEIATFLKPLLSPEDLSPSGDVYALFRVTPETVEAIKASSAKVKATLDVTCSKIPKGKNIDTYKTVFYMLVVLVKYSRANRVFDLHYAYVHAKDTSLWQWLRSDDDKRKRMASLEVESMNTLFRTLAQRSNGSVPAVTDDKQFQAELRELDMESE